MKSKRKHSYIETLKHVLWCRQEHQRKRGEELGTLRRRCNEHQERAETATARLTATEARLRDLAAQEGVLSAQVSRRTSIVSIPKASP